MDAKTAGSSPQNNGTTELIVSGMTCNNCARHVTEALRSVSGVRSAVTRLDAGSASVCWNAGATPDLAALVAALDQAGYKGKLDPGQNGAPSTADRSSKWSPLAGWHFNVAFGLAIVVPLMILEWVFGVGMARWYQWLSFVLVLPLQVFGGLRFYSGAWNQLKAGQSNMDTLVALGSTTAFLYSVWGLLAGWAQHLYFMDAGAILTLVSLGHFLEAKASAQAASSLRALLHLAPDTARRLDAHDREESVSVAQLAHGDRILLKAGDRIPTDGEVLSGHSAVNESMLTGESLPVEKSSGAKLFAGTINQTGQLTMKVTGVGDATALARIIQIVQEAQASRASIQRLGDRVSSVFVPIVVLVALASALWWGLAYSSAQAVHAWLAPWLWHAHPPSAPLAAAIYNAAAVLIIACPCAMGLATPIAIMAGANAAARRGILIRDGAALEKSGRITAILFDKTGTLTQGKISVAAVEEPAGSSSARGVAAALARSSTHPLSQAIAGLQTGSLSFSGIEEIRGSGIQGHLGNDLYRLGSIHWLESNGVNFSRARAFVDHWTDQSASIVALAKDSELIGVIALKDSLKPRAREVIDLLSRSGKKVFIVSGDNRRTTAAIARQLGVPESSVHAEVRPEGKVAVVKSLQENGERVAFAGDGINDAPALEQADLGIALMNASDVARESADIVLLKADLDAIPEALGLAQATLRTIKQNLFWAFFYNALGVPLAALGFLSPIFCALAMGLSDLIVIGNALRLRRWKLSK